jgi:hypothetical protein
MLLVRSTGAIVSEVVIGIFIVLKLLAHYCASNKNKDASDDKTD